MQGLKVELILIFLRDGPKIGPQRGFCDRLGVIIIVLLALVERLYVNRRYDPRLEPHAPQRSADKMGAEASLHAHDAAWELLKGGIQSQALDLLAYNQLAGPAEPDQVKRILSDVDSDDGELLDTFYLLCTHGCFSLMQG